MPGPNVKINLNSISDENFIDKYGKKSKELLDKGNILAEHVYNRVLKKYEHKINIGKSLPETTQRHYKHLVFNIKNFYIIFLGRKKKSYIEYINIPIVLEVNRTYYAIFKLGY